jgi:hypothetical protein
LEGKLLRVGVLCDGLCLAAWQVECLRKVRASGDAEIVLLVVNDELPPPRRSFLQKLRRNLTNGMMLWRAYERLILQRTARSMQPVDVEEEYADVPKLHCTPGRVGRFRHTCDERTIEAIQKHELDVLVRFGFNILTGDILDAAKYGVWSYHHGDPKKFRGVPPAFWEIHDNSPTTGVILQRLTETLDGGVVLQSARFQTIRTSLHQSVDHMFFGTTHFVAKSLSELRRDPQSIDRRAALEDPGPIYHTPTTAPMLHFVDNRALAWVVDQYRSFFRHQQWTVGLIRVPVTELFERALTGPRQCPTIEWLPENRGRFIADPMTLGEDGNLVVLVEEFDWRTGLGHIARLETLNGSAPRTVAVIRSKHHLSYPYLIEEAGERYCIPECADSGRVMLYRLDPATAGLAEHKVLLDNFPAVDPTLFKYQDRWWMFCTNAHAGVNEVLYAWHADTLLGDWEPHASNPIKIDIQSARPAGPPFQHGGDWIRPAQDCSNRYGGALVFNRILTLTPDEFTEETAARLEPDPNGPYPAGLHTICGAGGLTVIDGARYAFVPAEMRRALARKLRLGGGR